MLFERSPECIIHVILNMGGGGTVVVKRRYTQLCDIYSVWYGELKSSAALKDKLIATSSHKATPVCPK